jgi:hypothetical protein
MDDPRPASAFKIRTYSGHQRVAVRHALLKALTGGSLEPACHWTAELVASGLYADVWDTALLFFGRHVHAGNPRLVSYLALRADSFRDLVRAAPTELSLRNVPAVQRLFAEMMCVLCASPKRHPTDAVKVPAGAFVLTDLHAKLKAPRGDFAKLLPGDAPEVVIPYNELAYALASKRALEACYWLEWVLEFERACAKKKQRCVGAPRPYVEGRKDLVWIFWDQVFAALAERPAHEKLARATLRLFCGRFTPALPDAKRYLLYFAVALCCDPVDPSLELVYDKAGVDAVLAKCHLSYKDLVPR